ncbi:unnamed protein product [Cladocopium goreaui]|uniref:Uncharacterized protein C24H6.11c n=1 Tax=Cladocopium goreaui TaxID=2562237 RepID=A0A9P1M333_9DINO|nr:unnamed protein product [Cladocopium goreaui]
MAKKVWNEQSTGSRLVSGFLTALPITLISLASCVSYAHLMEPIGIGGKTPPLSLALLSSASIFSAGFGNFIHNVMSHCQYLVTCPDITFTLFMQAGQISVYHQFKEHHRLSPDLLEPTATFALRLNALLLGLLFWVLGKLHVMAALRYLPYPVVAGFLAMIGAAVIKGAFKILLADKQGESEYVAVIISVFFALCVLGLKLKGIRTSLSAPILIVSLVSVFYGWAFWTGRGLEELAEEGWLSPASGHEVQPLQIFHQPLPNTWYEFAQAFYLAWPSFESFLLVLVATIMRALTIIAIESAYADEPYSVDEEMSSLGLATLLGGLCGGVPMNATSAMTDLNKEGIKGDPLAARYTVAIITLLHLGMWGSGIPLVDYLPRFLLGGLLMQMGGGMLMDWAFLVTRRLQRSGRMVIWGMILTSLFSDMTRGIACGTVVALGFVIIRFSKLEVLKYHVCGVHFRSGELYSSAQRAILKKYGDQTEVVGLTGFVFEGVAISLALYLKETIRHPDGEKPKRLIIDCAACQGINDSAMSHLAKVAQDCRDNGVQLVFCSLSPYDEDLLRSWALEGDGCRIAASVTQALSEAERQTLEEMQQPVTPVERTTDEPSKVRALTRWLGPEKAQDLLSIGTWYEVTEQQEITCRDEVMTSVFLAVPGLSDVQMEVQTGTQNRPAMLLRTAQGAVCPAEALIGSHCRGKWIAVARSCGLMIHEIQLLKEETRGALLTLGLHQQLLESDQLSAMYTLSKGGGWRGVTFDAKTSKRLSKTLGSFGPRKRSSYSKRQSYVRVGSKQTGDMAVPITSSRSVRLPSDDGNIPVAAVLDFQRFVSDSGRLSAEFDEEASHPVEANEAPNKPNMMLNRYSVGANLNKLQSKTALGELRFNPDDD